MQVHMSDIVITMCCSETYMLEILEWKPLTYRRVDAKLCMMYKIVNDLLRIPSNQYIVPVNVINIISFTPDATTMYIIVSLVHSTLELSPSTQR